MMREETVFGPIHSRRLGASLGINLLPQKGKLCNFDCIYCECGWNADGLEDRTLPTLADVTTSLEEKLSVIDSPVDSITFSGDGEPTLNPAFPEIVDAVIKLRDRYLPGAKVSVLTNATTLDRPEVFRALRKVDNPILKLDAPSDSLAAKINHPVGNYSVEKVIEGMSRFGGDFILQTMFLKAPSWESGQWVAGWMDIVRRLRPREIQVYTIARETPAKGLEKYSIPQMASLVEPLLKEGFRITIN